MPKAEPHFDAEALIEAVHQQDIGLRVSTNDPKNFQQIVYKTARKLGKRIHIYASSRSKNLFSLLKSEAPK